MLKLGSALILLTGLIVGQISPPAAPLLDAKEVIPYFIEDGKGVPGYRETDHELAKLAFEAWSRESNGKLKFSESRSRDAALIRLRWISSREGLYGETQRVQVNGKAGAMIFVIPEVAAQGEPLASHAVQDALLRDTIVYLTCVHELGHAVGLPHTRQFEDIMYFFGNGGDILDYFMRYRNKLRSRADIAKFSGLSAGDAATLRRLY